jgi:hypothetical protein
LDTEGISNFDIQAYHQYGVPFVPGFANYKKGCTRLAAASDKVYQLLAHGQWFSMGTPASFTTKTGRRDIAEMFSLDRLIQDYDIFKV